MLRCSHHAGKPAPGAQSLTGCSSLLPALLTQVNMALASLSEALVHAGRGAFGAASAAARAAHAAADAAFLHPAVLTQLNFPDSHKLGIYMPLFLPVSVPLLQGAVRELARFIKKWRQWRRQQQQQQVKQPQQQQAPVHAG